MTYDAWTAQLNFLMKHSNLPKNFRQPINLKRTKRDQHAYDFLDDVRLNVDDFVQQGKNLILYSNQVGNGKTSWACKILTRYFANNAEGNGTKLIGYFISVPELLTDLSDFNYKNSPECAKLLEILHNADLVVFDELGAGQVNKVSYSTFYKLINYRIVESKSSIYTTNMTRDELDESLGLRLSSRIFDLSDIVYFNGSNNRGLEWEEIK